MYSEKNRTQVNKEKKELEKQINDLILGYEERWKQRFQEIKVIPILKLIHKLQYGLEHYC